MKLIPFIQTIFLSVAFLFLLNSCHDDFLQEKVYSNITPLNFYKTEQDAKAALASIYNAVRNSNGFQRQVILAAEYPGEATWPNNSGEAWRAEMDQFTWTTSSTGFYQIWSQLYTLINRANTVLTYIDNIEFVTPGLKEQVTGEVRFLRSFAYLYLIRFFENIPLKTEENMEEIDVTNQGTTDAVWSLIFSDFDYAKNNLRPRNTGADVGRATAGAAHVMLVKAYLTCAGKPWYKSEYWSKAAQEAKAVIDNSAYGYDLEEDYERVFLLENEHGAEYIFSLEYESNMGQGWDWPSFTGIRSGDQIKLDGWSSLAAEEDFFSYMDITDKRRNKTFVIAYQGVNNPDNSYTYPGNISLPHYNKYIDRNDVGNGTGDYAINHYITRFSDLLLMHSEAENEANGPTENALYGINRVRSRAGLPLLTTAGYTKETLREAIFEERLLELCEEGHAWFDMKRMDLMTKRIRKYRVEEKHYVFPIPQSELDVNPNLEQNALYK
ncbi:MAG: RagB/SusD family nutrient uptake outer membrane protein [Tannerellaceae bacterium]|nr:RagB/SusD family nutrient uptake outer membrane protein [Tannerellaceae bacterium]